MNVTNSFLPSPSNIGLIDDTCCSPDRMVKDIYCRGGWHLCHKEPTAVVFGRSHRSIQVNHCVLVFQYV